jgi:hypothetical protein
MTIAYFDARALVPARGADRRAAVLLAFQH